ncbi:MAG: hypothetical protein COB59_03830 [Rhodospirillaceae bacterium]|nr:MAG: hypothetical protein COB59_03830 [Rhodospirillaceae bacterium]
MKKLTLGLLIQGSAIWVAVIPGTAQALDELPSNLVNLELSPNLLNTVQEALPERQAVDQGFLNPSYDLNLLLSFDSQISISFIDEGAGYRNSLGYFNYSQGSFDNLSFGDIDINNSGRISINELGALDGVSTGLVFPNASKVGAGGSLLAGDTTVLGGGSIAQSGTDYLMQDGDVFEAGTSMGFLVMANAWTGSEVQGWDGAAGDPATYYSLDFLNPENLSTATLDTASSNSRHTAMMFADTGKNEIIMGFEDLDRRYGSDDDFNDAVFIVRSDPATALQDTNIEIYSAPAPTIGTGLAGFLAVIATGIFGRLRRQNTA